MAFAVKSPPSWTWDGATPKERADWVRQHALSDRRLSDLMLCELFALNLGGLHMIIEGDDWKPEYASDV